MRHVTQVSQVLFHVTHTYVSRVTQVSQVLCSKHVWMTHITHIWMSHTTHMWRLHISQMWMSHVTHMSMSHVTQVSQVLFSKFEAELTCCLESYEVCTQSRIFYQKSRIFYQKSRIFYQKSRLFYKKKPYIRSKVPYILSKEPCILRVASNHTRSVHRIYSKKRSVRLRMRALYSMKWAPYPPIERSILSVFIGLFCKRDL